MSPEICLLDDSAKAEKLADRGRVPGCLLGPDRSQSPPDHLDLDVNRDHVAFFQRLDIHHPAFGILAGADGIQIQLAHVRLEILEESLGISCCHEHHDASGSADRDSSRLGGLDDASVSASEHANVASNGTDGSESFSHDDYL